MTQEENVFAASPAVFRRRSGDGFSPNLHEFLRDAVFTHFRWHFVWQELVLATKYAGVISLLVFSEILLFNLRTVSFDIILFVIDKTYVKQYFKFCSVGS